MPNWCENNIKITGPIKGREEIEAKIKCHKSDDDKIGLFELLVGISPDISRDAYDAGGWYEANMDFWGTKWDIGVEDCYIYYEKKYICFNFNTAWGPATGFSKALSEKYNVDIKHNYSEPGNDFAGQYVVERDGHPHDHQMSYLQGLYKWDKDSFWSEIEQDIEDELDVRDSDNDADKFVEKHCPFVSKKDKKEVVERYYK
jgi:hypothetical protein